MMKTILIPLTLILTACSSIPTLYYKDGRQASIIRCEGNSWLGCMKQSSLLCQQAGYDIIERSSYRESGMFGNSDKKEMLIICKNAADSSSKKQGAPAINPDKNPNTNPVDSKVN
jgi:hypothetical protein